jgi:hypothetical protein
MLAAVKGLAFYESVAQIIPILVLVLAVEIRLGRLIARASRPYLVFAFVALVFIVVAEYRVLRVLQTESATQLDRTLTWSALGLLAGAIVGVLNGEVSRIREVGESKHETE